MFDNERFAAVKIRNEILSRFAKSGINVVFDKEFDEYFISTRDESLYYSEGYGTLVMEIKQRLWEQGIFNFYFTLDREERKPSKKAKEVLFASQSDVRYVPWKVDSKHITYADRRMGVGDLSQVA